MSDNAAPVLHVPAFQEPARRLPLSGRKSGELMVYGDYPDHEQHWLSACLNGAKTAASSDASKFMREVGVVEAGAPYGSYCEESQRISRATGLVANEETGAVEGLAIAQGRCWAFWLDDSLVLEFQSPVAIGYGIERFGLDYLKAACLQQMIGQSESLFSYVDEPERAKAVLVSFTGRWDETTSKIQELIKGRISLMSTVVAN